MAVIVCAVSMKRKWLLCIDNDRHNCETRNISLLPRFLHKISFMIIYRRLIRSWSNCDEWFSHAQKSNPRWSRYMQTRREDEKCLCDLVDQRSMCQRWPVGYGWTPDALSMHSSDNLFSIFFYLIHSNWCIFASFCRRCCGQQTNCVIDTSTIWYSERVSERVWVWCACRCRRCCHHHSRSSSDASLCVSECLCDTFVCIRMKWYSWQRN